MVTTSLVSNKKLLRQIEKREKISIFETCDKVFDIECTEGLIQMGRFIEIDECREFECSYCGKNVKIPKYLFDLGVE